MSVKCNEDVAQNAGIVFRLYPEGHEYITLSCDTKNISHNQEVIIEIYEPNVEGEEQHIYDLKGKVKDNKLKVQWQADYREKEGTKSKSEIDEKGYTVPEYRFYVRHFGFKSEAGPAAKLKCNFVERAINKNGNPIPNTDYILITPDKQRLTGKTDKKGFVRQENIFIGKCQVIIAK
jgi:hypothetical protein